MPASPTHQAPEPTVHDLLIVGGGPVGLFAAYYAGLRQMSVAIIDSLEELGGQLTCLYPEKYIYDVAGFPKVLAKDLARSLIAQGLQYHPTLCLGQTIRRLDRDEACGCFVITSDQAVHRARAILLCAGAGAFQPKKLALPGADQLEGRGVYYFVKERAAFAGQRVLVVGGGDSAIDWALNLEEVARHLTLIHRRNVFRAHEHSVRRLEQTQAEILTCFELKGFDVAADALAGAVVEHNQTGERRHLAVDAILVQVGFLSSLGPIREWPVEIVGHSIRVDSHMRTCTPGIYAAGDVASYEGKLKLIATGFGEAAIAVNAAKTALDPKARYFPGHSSELAGQPAGVVVRGRHGQPAHGRAG